MRAVLGLLLLASCWGENAHILEGTVVDVRGTNQVVVDHEEIKGLMEPMIMPFDVRDPDVLKGVVAGDRIVARVLIDDQGMYLDRVRVTGKGEISDEAKAQIPENLRPGQTMPAVQVTVSDGSTLTIGEGQQKPTAVSFLYTRCPMPEFCPALVARFQALQGSVGADAQLVAITIDPAHDTLEVLASFAETSGADSNVWRFGRVSAEDLKRLAGMASLSIAPSGETIEHGSRTLILDASGRLVERYDDNRWPLERVVTQLKTGKPEAPMGSDGTVTPLVSSP